MCDAHASSENEIWQWSTMNSFAEAVLGLNRNQNQTTKHRKAIYTQLYLLWTLRLLPISFGFLFMFSPLLILIFVKQVNYRFFVLFIYSSNSMKIVHLFLFVYWVRMWIIRCLQGKKNSIWNKGFSACLSMREIYYLLFANAEICVNSEYCQLFTLSVGVFSMKHSVTTLLFSLLMWCCWCR